MRCFDDGGEDANQLIGFLGYAAEFFSLPAEKKEKVSMEKGGKAWRGWFPLGGELTSGLKDGKEGFYFGTEAKDSHDERPLHGNNLFPEAPPQLKPAVLEYMERATALGRVLLRGISLGLGLPADVFESSITADPTILFRIFHYPPSDDYDFGVGEHCDYGLLTILAVDHIPGLQVKLEGEWIDVPAPAKGDFSVVVNLGDMLEKVSYGRYRSTPHRVKNMKDSKEARYSFPLFYDPSWTADATAAILDLPNTCRGPIQRWDNADIHAWQGFYGDYLTAKVKKCFPALFNSVGIVEEPAT